MENPGYQLPANILRLKMKILNNNTLLVSIKVQ